LEGCFDIGKQGWYMEAQDNFYRCTVRSKIYVVHTPTNALFIKLEKCCAHNTHTCCHITTQYI